jgi:serine/threonine protein kinase
MSNSFGISIQPSNRSISDFIINEMIGEGGYGKVYQCQDIITKEMFAIMMININMFNTPMIINISLRYSNGSMIHKIYIF